MACVAAVGGWSVREYMNMDEVVAMVQSGRPDGLSSSTKVMRSGSRTLSCTSK